ncbi:ABC transporter ATP-binding protein, partial [Pseudomonas syringae pv. tagetis]
KLYDDRVTVMLGGRTVKTLEAQKVSVEQLVQLTVGESVSVAEHHPATPGELSLKLRDLRSVGSSALNGVNMALHSGQIYGIA